MDVCSRWNKERDRNFIPGVFLTVRDKHKWNSKKRSAMGGTTTILQVGNGCPEIQSDKLSELLRKMSAIARTIVPWRTEIFVSGRNIEAVTSICAKMDSQRVN